MILFIILIGFYGVFLDIKNNNIRSSSIISAIITTIICGSLFLGINSTYKIIIRNNRVIFYKRFIPIMKKKILDISNIKELSINRTITTFLSYHAKASREIIYHLDIIDKELNCFRIYETNAYNDEFIEFAHNISSLIGIKLNDQNKIEDFKNVYKKRIF
jgi:hypothetical protein